MAGVYVWGYGLGSLNGAGALADAVVAISPAAHGSGGSTNITAQYDDLRQLVDAVPPARTRLAFVRFKAAPLPATSSDARLCSSACARALTGC